MSTATQDESFVAPPFAIVALKSVLLVASAACVANFWYANSHTEDYRLLHPLFSPWLWNLYLSFFLGSVVALISMWNWHKWGVWLLATMTVAMLFTEFYAMGFNFASFGIPVAFAAVWFASRPVAKRFV